MWSLGVLIGVPILIVLLLICAGWIGVSLSQDAGLAWIGVVAAVIILAFAAWAYYPYNAEYHKWNTVSGEVTAISSRLLTTGSDDNKSINQRFVVTFADGANRSCDDTRCALVKVGDFLELQCKRHWQYAGVDGYDCNYRNHRKAS